MATVVVFGGGGFLGRRLVDRLTAEGMTVRVAVRHPDPARIELRSTGFERVTVVPADSARSSLGCRRHCRGRRRGQRGLGRRREGWGDLRRPARTEGPRM